ncbi:unnamed protein product [Lampetra planeri]
MTPWADGMRTSSGHAERDGDADSPSPPPLGRAVASRIARRTPPLSACSRQSARPALTPVKQGGMQRRDVVRPPQQRLRQARTQRDSNSALEVSGCGVGGETVGRPRLAAEDEFWGCGCPGSRDATTAATAAAARADGERV